MSLRHSELPNGCKHVCQSRCGGLSSSSGGGGGGGGSSSSSSSSSGNRHLAHHAQQNGNCSSTARGMLHMSPIFVRPRSLSDSVGQKQIVANLVVYCCGPVSSMRSDHHHLSHHQIREEGQRSRVSTRPSAGHRFPVRDGLQSRTHWSTQVGILHQEADFRFTSSHESQQ